MPSGASALSTIGFDADDTLWQNEQFYKATQAQFARLLAAHAPAEAIAPALLEAQKRNLGLYGFGIKGFTLSMVETAIAVTGGRVPAPVIAEVVEAGRDLLGHPVEVMPHARQTLQRLAGAYRLVLITKGDLFDQERKLAQSGLADLFDAVEIVSSKTASTYERIFTRHGDGPGRSMMVGNSLKSDVAPALAAGSWGVYVPHDLTWVLEHAEVPEGEPRFHRLEHLGELADLLARIG